MLHLANSSLYILGYWYCMKNKNLQYIKNLSSLSKVKYDLQFECLNATLLHVLTCISWDKVPKDK
jgi:hypothetical protein